VHNYALLKRCTILCKKEKKMHNTKTKTTKKVCTIPVAKKKKDANTDSTEKQTTMYMNTEKDPLMGRRI
jgi:hypothetical protein